MEFDISVYNNPYSRIKFYKRVCEIFRKSEAAMPTPFLCMLAALDQQGRLLRFYTQNIDFVDTAMEPLATQIPLNTEGPWPKTIKLHGNVKMVQCTLSSQHIYPLDCKLFESTEEEPLCTVCQDDQRKRTESGKRPHSVGRLRPRIAMYNGGDVPDEEAISNVIVADERSRPDAVIVVGTRLGIPGALSLAQRMQARDGLTIWINVDNKPSRTRLDCDLVIRAECDTVAKYVDMSVTE
jgi:NAD+-dependent protein deacetylase SIR2